jgi:hypothetical protein
MASLGIGVVYGLVVTRATAMLSPHVRRALGLAP